MYYAHAFGERYELPLPLVYFVIGGALAVMVSFLLIYRRPVAPEPLVAVTEDVSLRPLRWPLAVLSLAGFAFLTWCGIAGTQDLPENIVPTSFWVVTWVAVPLTCGIIGDWTPGLNPVAILARLADSPGARRALLGSPDKLAWSPRVGWWPAVVAYFALASGELIFNGWATLPRVTAVGLLIWAVVSTAMGLLYGAPAWLARGEVFSVLFATWGRLGVRRFGAPGRRGFAGGLEDGFEPTTSRTVFVSLLLISISFDGFLTTKIWLRHLDRHNEAFTVLAFVVLAVATLAAFGVFAVWSARVGGHADQSFGGALRGLLPSLVPIAFGYLLAHYLQYVLINGQLLIPLLGNPAGKDWNLLPAPFNDDYEIHKAFLPNAFYWYVAVAAIIGAHIVAVLLAHRHLHRAAADETRARRSELPWLVAMVAYTMLSLWLIAQPVTK